MTTEEENEFIAERLLGWSRDSWYEPRPDRGRLTMNGWKSSDGSAQRTPSFTDWASAGLILGGLDRDGVGWSLGNGPDGDHECHLFNACDILVYAATAPLAVRAAALAYLREGKRHDR